MCVHSQTNVKPGEGDGMSENRTGKQTCYLSLCFLSPFFLLIHAHKLIFTPCSSTHSLVPMPELCTYVCVCVRARVFGEAKVCNSTFQFYLAHTQPSHPWLTYSSEKLSKAAELLNEFRKTNKHSTVSSLNLTLTCFKQSGINLKVCWTFPFIKTSLYTPPPSPPDSSILKWMCKGAYKCVGILESVPQHSQVVLLSPASCSPCWERQLLNAMQFLRFCRVGFCMIRRDICVKEGNEQSVWHLQLKAISNSPWKKLIEKIYIF